VPSLTTTVVGSSLVIIVIIIIIIIITIMSASQATKTFVEKSGYTVKDYLGFDVKKPGAFDELHGPAGYFVGALNNAYYADKVGISLGATELDVIPLLKKLRPYRSYREMDYDEWRTQCTAIFNLVHVCSANGELRLQVVQCPQ
jgi:hypothetical protein